MTSSVPPLAASVPDRIAAASRRPKSLGGSAPGFVSLAMGEPDGDTPTVVVDAAVRALRAGRTRYSAITGSPDLRRDVAAQLSRRHGPALAPDNVVVTHGGSAGLAATVLALVRPGDRVLVPEPTYSLYADQVAMAGGEVEWLPNHPDGSLDLPRLAAAAPGARMIVLCNPVNPTGAVFTPAELRGLEEILREHTGLYLLSDEAYGDILFDDTVFTSALTLTPVLDRVVLAGTFSKSYAMTGWRLGFVCAATAVADRINLVHRTINGAMNTFVQDAALEALRIPDSELREIATAYQRRRDLVLAHLEGLDRVTLGKPRGAFYAFPRIETSLPSEELVRRFADGGVLVRAGVEFGPSGEGHVRLSYATDEATLDKGLHRFVDTVNALPA